MNLTNLKDRLVEWLKGGPEDDVVVSSRVRLARNLADQPFMAKASGEQRAAIEERLRDALLSDDVGPPLDYVGLYGLPPLLRDLLLERRLISRHHAQADWTRGVAFDESERLSVLVNEEDHVRIQYILGGLRLREAHEAADRFDDLLGARVTYAFSDELGYLTACPTNVGTGLRASAMLHLPGLTMARELDDVIALVGERKLTLRGGYGEGTHAAGDFFQISNQQTLGLSEQEICTHVTDAALELAAMERRVRQDLAEKHPDLFRRRVERALEMLRGAGSISSQEALSFLSQVRMGMAMNVLPGGLRQAVAGLFLLTLPAHLQTMEGGPMDSSARNERRAAYVRSCLTGI